jgi:hypothetical protein
MAFSAAGAMDNLYTSDSLQSTLQWVPATADRFGEIGLGWYLTNYGNDSLAICYAGSNGRP